MAAATAPARAAAPSNIDLGEALADAEARYVAARPNSRAAFERNAAAMPGANTRSVLFYAPFPAVIAKGEAARLVDLDGHVYADLLGEYSAGLYGHSHPVIVEAIREALADGIALGGPNRFEGPLAAELCRRFPSLELVRFANSGTEANLFAISAARLHTGRPAVMVFDHGYHGGVFYFAKGADRLNAPFPWVLAPYNDLDGTLALIERHRAELAAVLVEPMQGGAGALPADPAFLQGLRDACTRHGIVLAFDEVMTSRMHEGGLQARLGVVPDVTTLGKYLGGGLTLSAFGGRAEIMRLFDPTRPGAVPHAGTFNNNVLAMAAGLAGLTRVATAEALDAHFARGERLKARLNALAERHDAPFTATGTGTILGLHCVRGPLRHGRDLDAADERAPGRRDALQRLLHLDLLERGHYTARRGYVTLPLPLEPADEDDFVDAVDEFLTVRRGLLVA
jgi:glutamate-1-semialdehyde 2,1-aminomutase